MPTDLNIIGVIPARFSSTRFPGKPLKIINDKPLIQHVWDACVQSSTLNRLIVATDDERIKKAVENFGGNVLMTSGNHETGTDRIAEVAKSINADLIVNIQGDEPMIKPEIIDQAVHPLIIDQTIRMGTICTEIKREEELNDPNVVKVITDKQGFAIYFSRSLIPYIRGSKLNLRKKSYYRHIGLYIYRKDFLILFSRLPTTPLEELEKLEQLRALENGYKIKVVETDYDPVGVDTPEDLEKVKKILE